MSLKVWTPEGIHQEIPVSLGAGERKTIRAFPFKWFSVEIENDGPDPVKVILNGKHSVRPITLKAKESRVFETDAPTYWMVELRTEANKTAEVLITTTR